MIILIYILIENLNLMIKLHFNYKGKNFPKKFKYHLPIRNLAIHIDLNLYYHQIQQSLHAHN